MTLKSLSNALKRRLDPKVRAMVESGYLSDSLKRTDVGIHIILNFVEEELNGAFIKYLQTQVEDAKKEAKEARKGN